MSDENENVISIKSGKPSDRTYERTLINGRRYDAQQCTHKGPFIMDKKLATVECQDCGALLNPIYVLEMLASHETYWNMRQKELSEYLRKVNEEIEGRERTKCTHCGNMTAIRFKTKPPQTWVPGPY